MIKSILIIIMMSTGFVSTTVSQGTYATMEQCQAAKGGSDAEIATLIEAYNKSPKSDLLGKANGTFQEACMTFTQYKAMMAAIAPGNAKIIAEARAKMME